jgi:pimeloyl-ACP methyl ester carboxylesterase
VNSVTTYSFEKHRIQLTSAGDPNNQPIVFIHGSPGTSKIWLPFLNNDALKEKFHLLAIDRPGFGGSQGGGPEYSLKKQSEAALASLSFNSSGKKPIIIGYSFGGTVAGRMIIDHSDKISGAVLVAAAVNPSTETFRWYEILLSCKVVQPLLPQFLQVYLEEAKTFHTEISEMLALWPQAKAYCVLIQGKKDWAVTPGNLEFLKVNLINSKILKSTLITGLDHDVPQKRPDLIIEAIDLINSQN